MLSPWSPPRPKSISDSATFTPRSELKLTAHPSREAAYAPVIDYHTHLDSQRRLRVLRIMDACGVEKIVKHQPMQVGQAAIESIERFSSRRAGIALPPSGWMDWERRRSAATLLSSAWTG